MRRLRPLLLVVSLLATPALAGSPGDPEIEDEKGDVEVQHLVDAGALSDENLSAEELNTTADVVKAWIDQETEDSFQVNVELADVPDDENLSSPVVDVWAHFDVKDGAFHTAAALSSPKSGAPVQGTYELYLDESKVGSLTGDVDVDGDIVSIRVPKADVRDPVEGDQLSSFYVTTHAPDSQAVLDYAPGAKSNSLSSLASADSADPTALDLSPTASYGDSYEFQAIGDKTSRISVDVTPSSLEVTAGEQESFAVRITNDADGADEVSLTLGNTPSGWSATLEKGSLTVPAKGSEIVTLYVSPPEHAEGHELVHLKVTSERGADKGASVSIVAVQPEHAGDDASEDESVEDEEPSQEEEVEGSSEEDEEPSPEEEAQEVPFTAPVAALAAALAAAFILRDRR